MIVHIGGWPWNKRLLAAMVKQICFYNCISLMLLIASNGTLQIPFLRKSIVTRLGVRSRCCLANINQMNLGAESLLLERLSFHYIISYITIQEILFPPYYLVCIKENNKIMYFARHVTFLLLCKCMSVSLFPLQHIIIYSHAFLMLRI